jgi:diadenosine tetraphosphatase ApaH/serine/threonine PP2A family protein phosphatase
MRVLVISDIHANLTALEAVLEAAGEVDAFWCLGDLVGYGPDPNECIERVRWLPNLTCLIGNHDAAALGQIDVDAFNMDARTSILWLQRVLTPANQEFLRSLPEKVVIGSVTLAHGSPRNPVWEYILDTRVARVNFEFFVTPYCFVGHSHLPVLYQFPDSRPEIQLIIPEANQSIKLIPRTIINPGSVGQPRDRDPRAAYAIYDTETEIWEQHRVPYDIAAVQQRIHDAGLPERHAMRLAEGW